MTMTYTQLTTNIEDICENSFTSDQLAMFVQQAEQKIYNAVHFPALRKNVEGNLTASNKYLSVPDDYLYPLSLALVLGSGAYTYLLQKDVNFIRDAYPTPTTEGTPKHYALFDANCIIVGPTPDASYDVEFHYGYYPESIVTASTTWLGDNFDSALLNGSVVEAARFMKEEQDIIANYEKLYIESMGLLKELGDGKFRQDVYRSGQVRQQVS